MRILPRAAGKGDIGRNAALNSHGIGNRHAGKVPNPQAITEIAPALIPDVANFQHVFAGLLKRVRQHRIGTNSGRVVIVGQFASFGVEQANHRIQRTAEPPRQDLDRKPLSGSGRKLVVVTRQTVDVAVDGRRQCERLCGGNSLVWTRLDDRGQIVDGEQFEVRDALCRHQPQGLYTQRSVGREFQPVGDFAGVRAVSGDFNWQCDFGRKTRPKLRRGSQISAANLHVDSLPRCGSLRLRRRDRGNGGLGKGPVAKSGPRQD